jgi:hypothetical protein
VVTLAFYVVMLGALPYTAIRALPDSSLALAFSWLLVCVLRWRNWRIETLSTRSMKAVAQLEIPRAPMKTDPGLQTQMVVPFVPMSNIFFWTAFEVAERVMYIPSIGFVLCIVYCLLLLVRPSVHEVCMDMGFSWAVGRLQGGLFVSEMVFRRRLILSWLFAVLQQSKQRQCDLGATCERCISRNGGTPALNNDKSGAFVHCFFFFNTCM